MCTFLFSLNSFSVNLLIWNSHTAVSITSIISEWAEKAFSFFPIHSVTSIKQTSNDSLCQSERTETLTEQNTAVLEEELHFIFKEELRLWGLSLQMSWYLIALQTFSTGVSGYCTNISRIPERISWNTSGRTFKQTLIRSFNFLGVSSFADISRFLCTLNCISFF